MRRRTTVAVAIRRVGLRSRPTSVADRIGERTSITAHRMFVPDPVRHGASLRDARRIDSCQLPISCNSALVDGLTIRCRAWRVGRCGRPGS